MKVYLSLSVEELFFMKLRLGLLSIFSLCLAGCSQPQYVDYVPYHSDGREKIKIAVAPVSVAPDMGSCAITSIMDSCGIDIPWNIAEEFSNSFRYHAMGCGQFFLLSDEAIAADIEKCRITDFFNADISFANSFCDADYLVALELIEHAVCQTEPSNFSSQFPSQWARSSSFLKMRLRLRVIDLTGECPKLALQEIFTYNYAIPREGECIDYNEVRWGSKTYPSTPWGKAHRRAVCDMVARVESIILNFDSL